MILSPLVPNKLYHYTIHRGFDSKLSNTLIGTFRYITSYYSGNSEHIIIDESNSDDPKKWTNSLPFLWVVSVKTVVRNIEALYLEDIFMEDNIIMIDKK